MAGIPTVDPQSRGADDFAVLSDERAVTAVVVFEVTGDRDPQWPPGPLPLPVPEWVISEGWMTSELTDRAARATYFSAAVVAALNGPESAPTRWSTTVSAEVDDAKVWAVEILRMNGAGPGRGLCAVHITAGTDTQAAARVLEKLVRLPVAAPDRIAQLTALLPAGWTLTPASRRAVSVVFAPGDAASETSDSASPALTLWELASATTLDSFFPSDQDLESGGRLDLSADWSAYVLRDGIAFLTRPAVGRFVHLSRTLVHSVYADVVLLVRAQLDVIEAITLTLAERGLAGGEVESLIRLERTMFDFRRQLWWTSTGSHGHANSLLATYQRGHEMNERVAGLISDVSDAARLAQSIGAARTSAALGFISVVGLPFAIVYAAAALFPWHGWPIFVVATAVALALSSVLALTQPMRNMIGAWRSDHPR